MSRSKDGLLNTGSTYIKANWLSKTDYSILMPRFIEYVIKAFIQAGFILWPGNLAENKCVALVFTRLLQKMPVWTLFQWPSQPLTNQSIDIANNCMCWWPSTMQYDLGKKWLFPMKIDTIKYHFFTIYWDSAVGTEKSKKIVNCVFHGSVQYRLGFKRGFKKTCEAHFLGNCC